MNINKSNFNVQKHFSFASESFLLRRFFSVQRKHYHRVFISHCQRFAAASAMPSYTLLII